MLFVNVMSIASTTCAYLKSKLLSDWMAWLSYIIFSSLAGILCLYCRGLLDWYCAALHHGVLFIFNKIPARLYIYIYMLYYCYGFDGFLIAFLILMAF